MGLTGLSKATLAAPDTFTARKAADMKAQGTKPADEPSPVTERMQNEVEAEPTARPSTVVVCYTEKIKTQLHKVADKAAVESFAQRARLEAVPTLSHALHACAACPPHAAAHTDLGRLLLFHAHHNY